MIHDHCTSFFYEIYKFAIFLLFLKPNSYVFFKKLKHVFMNFNINRPLMTLKIFIYYYNKRRNSKLFQQIKNQSKTNKIIPS
jgi:hypothetical protein